MIFVQNQFFYKNPVIFSAAKFVSYLIILIGLFIIGSSRRKELGGYASFKDIMQAMLVAILVIELFYTLFGILYLKVIDPQFMEKSKNAWLIYVDTLKLPEDQIESMKDRMTAPFDNPELGKMNFRNLISGFGFALIVDAVFAVIISLILKKEKKFSDL